MGLKGKPSTAILSEHQIEQMIEKGGSVASPKTTKRSMNLLVRLVDESMPDRIDDARAKRRIKPSVNVWINEAILEKLDREGK